MEEVKELAYDLRQKYAQIVGDNLEAISQARTEKDYPEYFRALENLFTIIKHKFKTKKTSNKELVEEEEYDYTEIEKEDLDKAKHKKNKKESKEDKKSDLDRYKELRQRAIDVANDYRDAFLGRTDKPEDISKLEGSLREMEMFLYYVMEKAKMFGSVSFNEGM